MKKLAVLLTALLILICCTASAEEIRIYAAEEDQALLEATGLSCVETTNRMEALNTLSDARSGMALVTQLELIQGLQGYSNGDVQSDFRLVQVLAQNDLYLVCSRETADTAGITGFSEMVSYLEDHPYELLILRCFDAGNEDYASMLLFEQLLIDSEMAVDNEEKAQMLGDGMYILVADTAKTLELAEQGHTVLGALTAERTAEFPDLACAGECGLPVIPGTYYALVASSADQTEIAPDFSVDDTYLTENHLHAPDSGISMETDIKNYVDYMTAEGLFFY